MGMTGPWHSRLSRRERQIMDILFRRGRAPASVVREELPGDPNSSTVRTQLRILEQKGHVRHDEEGLRYVYRPVTPRRTARRSALRHLVETFFDGSAEQAVAALLGGEAEAADRGGARAHRAGRLGRESGATAGRSVRRRAARRRAERKPRGRTAGGTVMSLLAVLTFKVSAILLLALTTTRLLRGSSAAARHWVLAVGVVSAAVVPALHVLPTPPVARMAPVGLLLLDALPLDSYVQFAAPADTDAVGSARLRPGSAAASPFTEPADTDAVGSGVASRPAGPRPGRPRPVAAAVAGADVVGRLAVTIWLMGAFAGLGVLLVGLARLRWLRASSSRVTDGRWHRLCADLARSCGLTRGVDLRLGPRPGLVATWGWRRPVVMLPASASGWSAERMRVVLLHELAHARRGDWMLQLAAEALRCAWWFNPLAWLVRARLRRESEHQRPTTSCWPGAFPPPPARRISSSWRGSFGNTGRGCRPPAMARPSNLERRVSTMLNPRTNRRPPTRFGRFVSLGVLVPASIVVAGLQVGPVSASRSVDSSGGAVGRERLAASSSVRVTESVPVAAARAALRERAQAGSMSVPPSAELTGNAVERERPAASPGERLAEPVPAVAARAALRERAQVGSVAVSRSAESTDGAVEPEQPSAPPGGRLAEPVPVAAAAFRERARVGPASRSAGSTGNAVEQEEPSGPSGGQIAELAAGTTGLREQRQTALDEPQAPLGDADRPTGRSPEPTRGGAEVRPPAEARTGIQGAAIEEGATGPAGGMDEIVAARSTSGLAAAGGGGGAPGARTSEAVADDGSVYKVLATRRASTLERELNAAAAVGYRFQTLTWRVGGGGVFGIPLPGDRREMMAIVARTAQPGRFSYRVVAARDETESALEARLNQVGEAGYRVREVGTSVILERDEAADPAATEFRVVTTSRISTLEAEIAAAGRDGYRPVGLAPPAPIEGLVAILARPTGMDPSGVVP